MSDAKINFLFKNFLAAFADGAVLFPLMGALALKPGFSLWILLFSTGLVFLFSGYFFRVPMSVQPLKSIAIAAIAMGASAADVRISGALLGLFCLMLYRHKIGRLIKEVPNDLVQGLQFSLGVLLITQGLKHMSPWLSSGGLRGIAFLMLLIVFLTRPSPWGLPLLGMVASLGFVWALDFGGGKEEPIVAQNFNISWQNVLALVLPQIPLTLGNSVLGSVNAAQTYFGENAKRVTVSNLLLSIGLGNILVGLAGGMPFCHGAGGITAHAKAGADHRVMNFILGFILIGLAILGFFVGGLRFTYHPGLMAVLLIITGYFHLRLADSTWRAPSGKYLLLLMGLTILLTQNMLWALGVGIGVLGVRRDYVSRSYK